MSDLYLAKTPSTNSEYDTLKVKISFVTGNNKCLPSFWLKIIYLINNEEFTSREGILITIPVSSSTNIGHLTIWIFIFL